MHGHITESGAPGRVGVESCSKKGMIERAPLVSERREWVPVAEREQKREKGRAWAIRLGRTALLGFVPN